MMREIIFFCLFAVALGSEEAYIIGTAVPYRFRIENGPPPPDAMAWASYNKEEYNETGFTYLEITTNGKYPSNYQAYSAGLLEGYLTRELITMHYNNTMRDYCKGQEEYCKRLEVFLKQNLDYIQKNILQKRKNSSFWYQAELSLNQLQGVQDSWTGSVNETYFPSNKFYQLSPLLYLNADGDFEDLESALKSVKTRVLGDGHCSALVKLLPDNADLYFSHVTWSGYSSMLRILKKYTLNYKDVQKGSNDLPGKTVTFSSSPGRIFSGDDFHLLSSGLATMETTIGNSNPALWSKVTPNSAPEWLRTIIANRLATTGDEWAKLFSTEKSGTYNNQWMILDYKRFQPHQPLKPGTLTILEEIPGSIVYNDETFVLVKQSYWPSYNIPYFKDIFAASGGPENVAKFGDWFTYDKSPRANIFRRDHSKVTDMDSMFELMRYNDYEHDEFSKCNCTPPYSAENAISARCDLNPANGTYPFGALGHRSHGATDAKITNYALFENLQFMAVCGPTYDPLPPFKWSTSGLQDLHEGHPDVFQFKPHVHKWETQLF